MFSDSSTSRSRSSLRRHARLLRRGRQVGTGTEGFSLIELLAVILIIAILAAIAIPAFLGQAEKGYDAGAKVLVGTAETAAGMIALENGGTYLQVAPAALHKLESSIPISAAAAGSENAWISAATPGKESYSVTATAPVTGDKFTYSKSATGQITRTCESPAGHKDCSGAETGTW